MELINFPPAGQSWPPEMLVKLAPPAPLSLADLEKKVQLEPRNFSALLRLGYRYKQEKMLAQAEQAFKKAQQMKPDSAQPHLFLGTIYKAQGQLDQAIFHCRQALEAEPGLPEAYYNLACYYSLKANAVAALENLERSYQLGLRDAEWVHKDPDLIFLRGRTNYLAVIKKYF